jgi:hypothetical protein
VFIREFPEFEHAFERLSSDKVFAEILTDYYMCYMELKRLSKIHGTREIYLQMQIELKDEIANYIINHIIE